MEMKNKIIADFNSKRKKFDEEYPDLDGSKYMATIPLDPFCRKIDMPIEKFPQWHKHKEEKEKCFMEYN